METILFLSLIGVIAVVIIERSCGKRERYEQFNPPQRINLQHQPLPPVHDNYNIVVEDTCENNQLDDDIPYNPNQQ